MEVPITMTIAGSDSSGGAGIQADLKTFSALKTYGCSAITAITAQNTQGVQHVKLLTPDVVIAQCQSILSDINVAAIKIGMLGNLAIIEALAEYLESLPQHPPLIIDPVITSTSGSQLLESKAITALKQTLFPKASLITPNLPEASQLLNVPIPKDTQDMIHLLDDLLALGSQAVLLKGGHLIGERSTDLFFDGCEASSLTAPYINTKNTHGTGCSLSAAITAFHAQKYSMKEAVIEAKAYVHTSIVHADELKIGKGRGPIHHFSQWWNE